MSANLDLVRSIYADWGRGDFSSVDWAHPGIEYVLVGVLAGESWVGLQGMKEGFLDWVRVWRDWTVTAEDYRELDGERVLVLYRDSGRMKESGPEGTRVENRVQACSTCETSWSRGSSSTTTATAPLLISASRRRSRMTPAEKLALAQRSYAAFGRLDSEALIPLYHPECEWRMGSERAAFGTEAFRGHDGLRELVAAVSEGVDSFEAVIDGARITSEWICSCSATTMLDQASTTSRFRGASGRRSSSATASS